MRYTRLIILLSLAMSLPILLAQPASAQMKPLVGAIRWDAWSPPPDITKPHDGISPLIYNTYSYREPTYGWYDHGVANHQAIVDQEIQTAASHGVDFFAFDWYPQDAGDISAMMQPYSDYLLSPNYTMIKHAFILFPGWVAGSSKLGSAPYDVSATSYWWTSALPTIVNQIINQKSQYLMVDGNRPVIIWFGMPSSPASDVAAMHTAVAQLTAKLEKNGFGAPYYIDNNMDMTATKNFGFQSATSYGPSGAVPDGASGHTCWSEQVAKDKANWNLVTQNGMQATLGLTPVNDPRPRIASGLGNYNYWVDHPVYSEWQQHILDRVQLRADAASQQRHCANYADVCLERT